MREIKFRGKTVSTKEWVYGDLVHNAFNGHRIFPVGIQIPGCYPDEVIAETVGQFTGLHDKNGKEIYEGDIVKYGTPPENGVATISSYTGNNLYFCWHNSPIPPTNADIFGCKDELEVIGNVHENPELLEATC